MLNNYSYRKSPLNYLREELGKEYQFKYRIIHDKPIALDIVLAKVTNKNFKTVDIPLVKTNLDGDKLFVLAKVRVSDLKPSKEETEEVRKREIENLDAVPAVLINRKGEVLIGKETLRNAKEQGKTELNCWVGSDKKSVSTGLVASRNMGEFSLEY